MKTVEYDLRNQWVGFMRCPKCDKDTPAWRSSGMSQCFPHFYCDTCSNVIRRLEDQKLVWNGKSRELLEEIVASLPRCSCGGVFVAGAAPKCRHCGAEYSDSRDPVDRLHDPHMIVMDGATVFKDNGPEYIVKIVTT